MAMLSKTDAISFLTNTLKLCDIERRLKAKDDPYRYQLLCETTRAFHEVVPFQSLTLMAEPLSRRHKPTPSEIINEVCSGRGGLCYTLNTFMKFLLEALDYDVYHVMSTVTKPNDHVITVVCISGDKYLVEVGCGYPTFNPIPLNFIKESPIYEDSYIKYKFKWINDHEIERQNLFHKPDSTWRRFCSFNVTPSTLEEIAKHMDFAYTCEDALIFHKLLRTMRFIDGRAVCLRDMTLLKEDEAHILQETELSSKEEFLEAVREYFPLLVETGKKALVNWVSPVSSKLT